jgi:hypothetical protein
MGISRKILLATSFKWPEVRPWNDRATVKTT